MKLSAFIRGKKANAYGKQFEVFVHRQALKERLHIIRMPDGCRTVRMRTGELKTLRVQTPFDYVLIWKGVTAFFDCKTFDSDRISKSQLTDHQVEALCEIEQHECPAGYLINFREINSVAFIEANKLKKLEPRSSILAREMLFLGEIENFDLIKIFTEHMSKPSGD